MIKFSHLYCGHNDPAYARQSGFSLVELAIAIACIGLLMGGTIMISNAMNEARYVYETRQKMNIIADYLSLYVQAHNRLPCPTHPVRQNVSDGATTRAAHFGEERQYTGGAVNNMNRAGHCYNNQDESHGIVPFRTLGLEEEYAQDAWGRYFTYVVSPVSARYNYLNAADTTVNRNVVHYVKDIATNYTQPDNRMMSLAPKYRFCHGMTSVPRADGGANFSTNDFNDDFQYFVNTADDFPVNRGEQQETTLNGAVADRLFAYDYQGGGGLQSPHTLRPAFALISHGSNGFGAYLGNETNGKIAFLGSRPSEQANADIGTPGRNAVYGIDQAIGGGATAAELMDDMVLMLTQDQVYARKGGLSCVTP